MNRKRLPLYAMLIMGALSLVIVPGIANATVDVRSAKIIKAGYYPGAPESGIMVQLADQAGSPAWAGTRQFYLSEDLGNKGFATLLSAFSLGKTVWVRIAGSAEPGSLISIIYVNE